MSSANAADVSEPPPTGDPSAASSRRTSPAPSGTGPGAGRSSQGSTKNAV
ncbi:hypothetical protein ACFQXA_28300 [Nocardiopsis composta]